MPSSGSSNDASLNSGSRRASSRSATWSMPISTTTSLQPTPDENIHPTFTSQIDCKINPFCDHLNQYLHIYVPSRAGHSLCATPQKSIRSSDGEAELCTRIVHELDKLVEDFPDTRRLVFLRNEDKAIKLPYKMCDDERHRSVPTIIASLPGKDTMSLSSPDWRNISLAFDVMPLDDDDPLGKCSPEHDETLIRLSKHARNIMIAQSRLFVFVVGIYGSVARIFRFDHTAAIVFEPFSYDDEPSIMQQFLWRFVHPLEDADIVVGADPTVQVPNDEDIQWAEDLLAKSGKGPLSSEERRVCRWMAVDEPDGRSTRCFAFRLRYINPRLFSRASMVWEALKDDTTDGSTMILKDSWRLVTHSSELGFYDAIQAGAHESTAETDEELGDLLDESILQFGISQLVAGVDLGEVEARAFETSVLTTPADKSNASPPDSSCPADGLHIPLSGDQRQRLSPLPYVVCHRTISASLRDPSLVTYHERSHMRLAVKTVGKSISHFKSTRELVEALRDAIKGHRTAYKAGVIHRDISEGNVMIAENAPFKGFIGDFDYSFNWKQFLQSQNLEVSRANWETYVWRTYCSENGEGSRSDSPPVEHGTEIVQSTMKISKAQTGTLYFMAIEILEGSAMHEARHDLESFYWLLVWLVLRHTEHSHSGGRTGGTTFFMPDCEYLCSLQKRGWLLKPNHLSVPGNRPLSLLLREFGTICLWNCSMGGRTVVPLTHEVVLAKFDEALACEDWPKDDAAIPQSVTRSQPLSSPARTDTQLQSPHQAEGSGHIQADHATAQDVACTDIPSRNRRAAHASIKSEQLRKSCHAPLETAPRSRSSSKRTRVDPDEEASPSKRARRATVRGKASSNTV